jgi:hypothetical protein
MMREWLDRRAVVSQAPERDALADPLMSDDVGNGKPR